MKNLEDINPDECPVRNWCAKDKCPEDYEYCENYREILKKIFPKYAEYQDKIFKARK